jgi:hypothetical protein
MKITKLSPPCKRNENPPYCWPPWGGGGKIFHSDGTYTQPDDRYWRIEATYTSPNSKDCVARCRGLGQSEWYLLEGEFEEAGPFLTRHGYPVGDKE